MYKTHERLRDRRNQILTGEDGLAAGGSGAERLGGVVGFGSGAVLAAREARFLLGGVGKQAFLSSSARGSHSE